MLPGYHPYQARELELEMALQLALSSARGAARRGEAERRLLGVEVHGHLGGLSMHTVGGAGAPTPTRGEGTYGGEGAYGVRRRGGECTRVKHGGLKGVHEGCASPCTPLHPPYTRPCSTLAHPCTPSHTPCAPSHTPCTPSHTPRTPL